MTGRVGDWSKCNRMMSDLPGCRGVRAPFVRSFVFVMVSFLCLVRTMMVLRMFVPYVRRFVPTDVCMLLPVGLAYGVNQGILDHDTFAPTVLSAWHGERASER